MGSYGGLASLVFWYYEASWGAGYPCSGTVLGINKAKNLGVIRPKYVDEIFHAYSSLNPKCIWTKSKEPSEWIVESIFADPFLMAAFFQYRMVEDSWGTGAKEIYGNLHQDAGTALQTLWFQVIYSELEGGTDIVREYAGGIPVKYEWLLEAGMYLMEMMTIKFIDDSDAVGDALDENSYTANFIDAQKEFSGWESKRTSDPKCGYLVRNATLAWTGGADATFASINVENFHMTLETPSDTRQIYSSLVHGFKIKTVQTFSCEITGTLAGVTTLQEAEKTFANRDTDGTLIITIDDTVGYEKYLQFTNAYVDPESIELNLPEAGNPIEITCRILGGVDTQASFSFHYDSTKYTDPNAAVSQSA